MTTVLSCVAVATLMAVHLFAGRLRFLEGAPRSRWLSAGGGISVAYVFLHLLPELGEGQEIVAAAETVGFLDRHVYLVALIGLAAFYGLERLARRQGGAPGDEGEAGGGPVFAVHVASFALYNAVVGYLLVHRRVEDEGDRRALVFFAVAMATHFVVNDYGLRERHRAAYTRVGRWVLAGTVLLGWVVGLAYEVPETAVILLQALLGGGIILNVLKEELPAERESRFSAFAFGAGAYAVLLFLAG